MKANEFLDWDEAELAPETEAEVFGQLLKAIANNEGAGCFFVQCSRGQEESVIEQLQSRFGQVSILQLERDSVSVYPEAMALLEQDDFDVLVVRGLDQALLGYEDAKRTLGWDDVALHNYDPRDVPKVLHHLNQIRECWYEQILRPVVFVVPPFVVRYLILRCPDFYDWRVGTFVVPMDEDSQNRVLDWTKRKTFIEYQELSISERFEKVLELRELIEKQELSSSEKADLLVEQGLLWESGEEYQLALSCYAQAINRKKDCVRAYRNQADVFDALGRTEEKITSYEKVLEFKPDDHQAWNNRGVSLDNLGRKEEAIASYEKALEFKPDDHDTWYNQGLTLDDLGRKEEAIASYEQALKFKPDDHQAWNNRGVSFRSLGRKEEALTSYEKALEFKPDDHQVWNNRGNTLRSLGQAEEAIASYEKALEFKPDYLLACSNRGLALEALQRYEEAEVAYRQALAIEERAFDYTNLGDVLRRQERYDEAITSYNKALEIEPDYRYAYYEIGWTYAGFIQSPNYAAARAAFQACLEYDNNDPGAYYGFACIDSLQHHLDSALEHLQHVFELDPGYRDRARKDKDFDPIRHDPRFQALINPD